MHVSRRIGLVVVFAVVGSLGFAPAAGADAIGWARVDGSGIEPNLITVPAGQIGGVAVGAGHVYWANPTTSSIERANLDGSGVEPKFIAVPLPNSVVPFMVGTGPNGVAVDAAHIYWTIGVSTAPFGGSGWAEIWRANLDGSGAAAILVTADIGGGISAIAVGGGHIYWTSFSADATIGRVNVDGSGGQQRFITPPGGFLTGIAVDNAHLYWSQACLVLGACGSGTISRANLDGSGVRRDFITAVLPTRLALDAGHIYWAKSDAPFYVKTTGDTIGRANLDGSGVQQDFITIGSVNLFGVAVNGTHIYWTSGPRPTSAFRLTCSPNPVMAGERTTCTATVTNMGTPSTPTGTVTFAANSGTFSARSCTLSGSGVSATCQARYKPTSSSRCAQASGPCSTITARYSGDSTHTASTESSTIGVFVLPHLTNVSQSEQRWRRGNALPHLTRARPPIGTTFTFTLDHGNYAQVQFDFTHVVPGRLVGSKCVAPTTRNRGKPKCRRTVTAATLRYSALVQNPALHTGRNRLHFEGRINRRSWLAPGPYTLKITAAAYGRASRPAFLHFTILR